MEVKTAIKNNRSIRKYKDTIVSKDLIKNILESGRLAPSANNKQPWKYMIINDLETKTKLKENKIFKQEFVYKAPTLIICCANSKADSTKGFNKIFDNPYDMRVICDLAISSQNIILRAKELGLGTCYIGWMNRTKIKKILNIPKKYIIPFIITLGYPDEEPNARPRKELNEIIIKN
ncbi:MAG: nitroreductase family protein [DPANN group archaeon]|nr:nitroreductase family protein [DPANN group archaeon]